MLIVLKCLSCNQVFQVPFKNNGYIVERCPHCQNEVGRFDDEAIHNMTDRAEFLSKHLRTVKLIKLTADDSNWNIALPGQKSCFQLDIEALNAIYEGASLDVKKQMECIIDKVFLLMHNDAKTGKLNKLEQLRDSLNAIHNKHIKEESEEMGRLLEDN